MPNLVTLLRGLGRSPEAPVERGGSPLSDPAVRARVLLAAEILAIVAWAVYFSKPYQDFDPNQVPNGREFLSNIQSHFFWERVKTCGVCALWNGSVRGGYPALADPQSSMLHPLVALGTLGWGVVNGSKIALIGAFALAGLGQWALARTLGLGTVARLWSAAMAVVAGNLAGRMEPGSGNIGLALATASATLVFAPLVALLRTGNRRWAVLLGLALATTVFAGQGYVQLALVPILPAVVLTLLPWDRARVALLFQRLALAMIIALLISGPFLVPFLQFSAQFGKDIDTNLASTQPITYVALNLVINEPSYYAAAGLHPLVYPYLYVNFVGVLPVLLALWAGWSARDAALRRVVIALALAALLALWLASGAPFKWMVKVVDTMWFTEKVTQFRFVPVMAGLAVPPILALAAISLDRLFRIPALNLHLAGTLNTTNLGAIQLDLRWLMIVPLLLCLSDAYTFARHWIGMNTISPAVFSLVDAMITPDLQWVNTPFGEQYWIEPALRRNLKLSLGTQGWYWAFRAVPEPMIEANRLGVPQGMTELLGTFAGTPVYAAPTGREYAAVTHAAGTRTACYAQGTGGYIDVTCGLAEAGTLTVKENVWSGWWVWVDGSPATLGSGPKSQWLTVAVPAGQHAIRFRYWPLDAAAGLALWVAGLILAIRQWRRERPVVSQAVTAEPMPAQDS